MNATDSVIIRPDEMVETSQGELYRELEEGTKWPPTEKRGYRRVLLMARLTANKKTILVDRYIRLVEEYRARVRWISTIFYAYRCVVQTGSVLIPALLTIQKAFPDSEAVFWMGWGTSVVVGLVTSVATVTNVDKKYFTWKSISRRLQSEGWQYFSLSGRYTNQTHEFAFPEFCLHIEKLKRKEDELDQISSKPGVAKDQRADNI